MVRGTEAHLVRGNQLFDLGNGHVGAGDPEELGDADLACRGEGEEWLVVCQQTGTWQGLV